ncbi:MAG: hypothetical protein N2484_16615 [Clostridia bacterium]|nr:hypothetical protein [Clostridia bacterium]
MNYARRLLTYFIVHTTVGIIALLYILFGQLPDSFREGMVSGIAGACIVTGIIGIIAGIRLLRNPKKAKEAELSQSEERAQFIRMKAFSSVSTIMLYVECLGTLMTGLMGFKEAAVTLASLIFIHVLLLVGFNYYYGKKF